MRKFLSMLGLTILILAMTACVEKANETELSESNESTQTIVDSETEKFTVEATEYDVEIYDGEYVNIVCDRITGDGIEFSITSKLQNNSLSVYVDKMAVDGIVPNQVYSELSFIDIEPGMTVTAMYGAEMNYTDHELISACFEIFNDEGNGIESVDIVDFDLGGNENLECEEPDGRLVHDSEFLSISYVGADDNGIRFRNTNKMDKSVTIVFDNPFTINGKEYDEIVTVMTLPAHSKSDYYFDIKDFEPDYTPDSIESMICSGYIHDGVQIEAFSIDSNVEVSESYST